MKLKKGFPVLNFRFYGFNLCDSFYPNKKETDSFFVMDSVPRKKQFIANLRNEIKRNINGKSFKGKSGEDNC